MFDTNDCDIHADESLGLDPLYQCLTHKTDATSEELLRQACEAQESGDRADVGAGWVWGA
jgi:hypothetical protein